MGLKWSTLIFLQVIQIVKMLTIYPDKLHMNNVILSTTTKKFQIQRYTQTPQKTQYGKSDTQERKIQEITENKMAN